MASFAAVWPIEHDPGRKVVTEILEAVRLAGGCKKQIASRYGYELFAIEELPMTFGDDVNLILRVGCLRIVPARRIHFHRERAVAEQLGRTYVGFGAYRGECSFEGNVSRSHDDEY